MYQSSMFAIQGSGGVLLLSRVGDPRASDGARETNGRVGDGSQIYV